MLTGTKGRLVVALAIFILAGMALGAGLGSRSYSSPDEKRYIQSAYEMAESGDWITPRYHNRPRFQKPILFYWLSASSVSLFGKTWLAARIPSVIFGAGSVLLTFLLGASLFNKRAGLFSAALLPISWVFFLYSRLSTPDMATLFFITLSMYLFLKIRAVKTSKFVEYSFFAALGLAALTKGLAGLLIPVIVIGIFIIAHRREELPNKVNIPLGIVLTLLIALPWFFVMYKTHGSAYIDHIWKVETVNRARNIFTGGGSAAIGAIRGILRYICLTFIIFFPASILIPGAAAGRSNMRGWQKGRLLIIAWITAVIVFYALIGAGKTHYLLAMAPAVALLLGEYLSAFTENKGHALLFYLPVAAVIIFYCVGFAGSLYIMKYLLDIKPPFWCHLLVLAPIASAFVVLRGGRFRAAQAFIASSMFVLIFMFAFALPALNEDNGLISITDKVLSLYNEGDVVGIGSHFISHNRVDAYLDMSVKKINVDLYNVAEQLTTSRAILRNFLEREEK
ncbi:MAG: glycosyltransferase family 39 protein, partial [Candidatus Omnitrophota bacterium]